MSTATDQREKTFRKAADRLFEDEGVRRAFCEALRCSQSYAPCGLWTRGPHGSLPLAEDDRTPAWWPDFAARLENGFQPGKHSLHAEGAIYSLDFSSVFAGSALLVAAKKLESPAVLDVCAAPGGKTIFCQLALEPRVLVANEVIGKRLGILRHNLKRCGIPAFTQRLDVSELSKIAPSAFDVVVVDAPCSGQSLLAKGIENPGCFHKATVNRNLRRQRRIIVESARTVSPGGFLFYATCTFAVEENERVVEWLLKGTDRFVPVEVPHLAKWASPQAAFPCYRLYPHSGLGAGAFCCLLRQTETIRGPGQLPAELLRYPVLES
jgi:16S rRNA C967 or C1407 C5-methylase (RsmB/RsmF family)